MAYVLGSVALQVALLVAVVVSSAALRREAKEPPVEVRFLRSLPQAAPPPPAPPRRPAPAAPRPPAAPQPTAPAPLVQPREIAPEIPADPGPPEPDPGPAGEADGVVVGVASGKRIGVPAAPAVVDEGPTYPAADFRKPRTAEPGCVQRAIRIPDEWMERLGAVTVRFAIDRDGTPSRFQPVGGGLAERVAPEIWRAVCSCRWLPGADPQGRAVALWVVLPIRFTID